MAKINTHEDERVSEREGENFEGKLTMLSERCIHIGLMDSEKPTPFQSRTQTELYSTTLTTIRENGSNLRGFVLQLGSITLLRIIYVHFCVSEA